MQTCSWDGSHGGEAREGEAASGQLHRPWESPPQEVKVLLLPSTCGDLESDSSSSRPIISAFCVSLPGDRRAIPGFGENPGYQLPVWLWVNLWTPEIYAFS